MDPNIQSEAQALSKKILSEVSSTIEDIKKYQYPILIDNVDGRPELIGSCILLCIEGRKFLVTAGHVINDIYNESFYIGYNGTLLEVSGLIRKTVGNDQDRVDIAVLEFENGIGEQIDKCDCISYDQIYKGDCSKKKIYSFIGYPATKSKIDRSKVNHIKSKMYEYFGISCNEDIYDALGAGTNTHIAIIFDKNKCKNDSGNLITFPNPNGISGGGVWLHRDLNALREPTVKLLAGIAIEHHSREKCLLGINILAIIELLKYEYQLKSFDNWSTPFNIIHLTH